jgi:hypothetical protein
MNSLYITSTQSSPEVIFNFEDNKLIIKGICTPQNPKLFFDPIISAIEEYQKTHTNLTIDIYLDYFNTGSSKCLLNLFTKAAINPDIKINTIVNWIVESDDSELKEAGEVFEEITGLKFNFLSEN